ncbi:hypothetical protein SAMN04488033_11673 [Salegentibacter agarivorans]|uniref:Uncharacterized protein n=1 Tax=Salegentibacter agarivorans TaxID=345907 RepID=A0A1I2MYT5_9FLAO|nr:hypothetical protein [Salegentibacter agarivorans]SFF95799.1 hypothetical protein SAMN04488033_11673 [Salegentibacter agarivorans]
MNQIINIINENLGPKNFNQNSFTGNVFFRNENGLNIERSVYNRLLNKYNAAFDLEEGDFLTSNDELLLVFVIEIFEDNSDNLFRMDRNYYLSVIILEWGVFSIWSEETEGSDKQPDEIFALPWEDIDYVELFDASEGGYLFRFFEKNKAEQHDLLSNRFGTSDLEASQRIINILNETIEYKKEIIANSTSEHSELKTKINNLIADERNYEAALEELENFKDIYDTEDAFSDNTAFYHLRKTYTLISSENYGKALKTIDSYINRFKENHEIPPYAFELKGEILLKTNNILPAVNCLALSEEGYEVIAYDNDVRALKEESYSRLKDVFLDVPFNQRKLIFIGEDVYATQSGGMIILKVGDLPMKVNFPVGHPHVNEVYTCHPHKQDFYLPVKSYSEELFLDRIHEFSWLLQCLGAATLEISSSTSESSDQTVRSKTEVDADFDYKLSGGKVNYQGENTNNSVLDGKLNIAKKQVFRPTKSPFVPDDLVWYHSNTSWQRLAHQRLNGSIMMHNELISSSQSETLSAQELKQVEAELKLLLPKLGVKYNSEEEVNTSSFKKYEWIVNVEFADVNELSQFEQPIKIEPSDTLNSDNKKYNSNLEKYKEDVLLMIEDDGIIDEMERNILNRKIKKYGLSEEDARAIENDLITSGYSENELKYIEELKEFLEDGGITEIERKILDRYAQKFGVTIDIQKKINGIFIP